MSMESSPYFVDGGVTPITILGLDCDDPKSLEKILTQKRNLLQGSDIICGAKHVLAQLSHDPELAGRLLPLTPPLEPLFECLTGLRKQGMKVVVLAEGDPLFFGVGVSLARRMDKDAIKVRPAISSLQAACARLCLPWHNVYTISLHGIENLLPLYTAVTRNQPICILTGSKAGPDVVARLLLDRGADWFDVHIFEHMGKEIERVRSLTLEECAKSHSIPGATVILVPQNKTPYRGLGLISALKNTATRKRPIRGVVLELLRISLQDTVWDIGAASGFMAIEASTLANAGRVIAIESNVEKIFDIQLNRRSTGAVNLGIQWGHAPECLPELPQPDRICIEGGLSEKNALPLLEYCAKALAPAGRMVASCYQRESVDICKQYMESLKWPLEILEVKAAYMEGFGPKGQINYNEPVFLFSVQKPASA